MSTNLLVLSAVYLVFALPLSVFDSRKFRIPFIVPSSGLVAMIVLRFVLFQASLASTANMLALALGSSALIFAGVKILSAGAVGFDDVVFGLFTAAYTGFYDNIVAVVFAALCGVLYYLIQAVVQKWKKHRIIFRPIFAIPLVPFVTAGAILEKLLFFVVPNL